MTGNKCAYAQHHKISNDNTQICCEWFLWLFAGSSSGRGVCRGRSRAGIGPHTSLVSQEYSWGACTYPLCRHEHQERPQTSTSFLEKKPLMSNLHAWKSVVCGRHSQDLIWSNFNIHGIKCFTVACALHSLTFLWGEVHLSLAIQHFSAKKGLMSLQRFMSEAMKLLHEVQVLLAACFLEQR